MVPYRMNSYPSRKRDYLDSEHDRSRQRNLALATSVGTLMVAIRRGGLSGLALGAFSGFLAYRATTGQGLSGAGTDMARYAERALTGHRTGTLHFTTGVTIARPAETLYAFWRDFGQLPRVMASIDDVQINADGRSHWRARNSAGETFEWDAEITEDVPDQRIAWQTVAGADVPHQGEIRFMPSASRQETQVELSLRYDVPHGLLSAAPLAFVNALSREALREDLRHFKQLMEAGEIPTGTIHAVDHHGATS